jgi:3-oxoacid CoA-transferase subunit A
MYDENVKGDVYIDDEFPNIRYFKDGGIYDINGHRTLVIGGAYSVDKWYRLSRAGLNEQTNDPAKTGWFPSELLTEDEMSAITCNVFGQEFDFVFSHTCPLSWEPRDLFLSFIDQSTVDKSMEQWLDVIKADIRWGVWCFGHFHKDRIERPRVEQFYGNIEDLEAVWNRWFDEKTIEHEYWLEKSPNYYMEESK